MARITIIITDKVQEKLRKMQAEKILTSSTSVSFSSVLNEVLEKALGLKK